MIHTYHQFTPATANGFKLGLLASAVILAAASMNAKAASGFTCGTETPPGSGDYVLDQSHSGAIGSCNVNADGDTITITTNGEMSNSGGSAMVISADDVTIDNSGTLAATSTSFGSRGIYASGTDNLTINNNNGALIESIASTAIEIQQATGNPASATINNDGIIRGFTGINTSGAADGTSNVALTLENAGTIQATLSPSSPIASGSALRLSYTDAALINNTGIITSRSQSQTVEITYSSSVDDFINEGTISNASSGRAVFVNQYGVNGGSSVTNFVNDGFISNNSFNNPTVHFAGSTLGSMTNTGDIVNAGSGVALYFAPEVLSGSGTTINNSGVIQSGGSTAVFITSAADLGNFINSGTITGNFEANATNDLRQLTIAGNNTAIFNGFVSVDGASVAFQNGAVYTPLRYQNFVVNDFNLSGGTLVLNPNASDRTAGGNLTSAIPSIQGDYNGSGGTMNVVVVNDTTYGQLSVDGDVDLNNSIMHVDVQQNGLLINGATLQDVITATGTINYGSFAVTDNSALFDFDTVRNTSDLDLTLTADGQGESTNSSGGGGGSPAPVTPSSGNLITAAEQTGNTTAQGPAGVVQGFANDYASNQTTGDAQLDAMVQALGGFATNEELANATATLAPASGAAAQQASDATSQVLNVIGERADYLHGLATGLNSGDESLSVEHLWLQPFGSWAEQDHQDGVSGYDVDSYGLVMGLDTAISSDMELGLAFAYTRSQVDSDMPTGGYDTDINSYQLTGYFSKLLNNTTILNANLGLGYSDYDARRHLFNNAQALADYSSWATHLNVELEKHYGMSDSLNLAMIIGADYRYVDVDGYTETGAGALNLRVNDESWSSLVASLGTELSYAASPDWLVVTDASLGYDVLSERTTVTSAFAGGGATFTTQGIKPDAWVYEAGVGTKYTTDTGAEITAQYDFQGRDNFRDHRVSLNLRWMF